MQQLKELHAQTLGNRDETIRGLRQDIARLVVALQDARNASKEAEKNRTKLEQQLKQEQHRRAAELAQVRNAWPTVGFRATSSPPPPPSS